MKIWENHGGSRCRVWLLHCLLKVAVTQFLLIISKQSMCSTHDVVQVQSATGCFPCSLLEPPSYYMLVPRQTTIDKSHRSSSDALDRIRRGFDGGLNWNNKILWKVKLRGKSRQVIYIYMQDYLLPAMDMAKVGGPLSAVKVCTSILCVKIGYR